MTDTPENKDTVTFEAGTPYEEMAAKLGITVGQLAEALGAKPNKITICAICNRQTVCNMPERVCLRKKCRAKFTVEARARHEKRLAESLEMLPAGDEIPPFPLELLEQIEQLEEQLGAEGDGA